MSVRGPNNVGGAVQTDPTLLCYASAIREQKKCWELLAEKFERFQTLRNNTQQHPTTCNRVCKRTQHVTSNNVESCWSTMLRPFAWGLRISSWYSAKVSFCLRSICHECVYDAYINIENGNRWRGRKTENYKVNLLGRRHVKPRSNRRNIAGQQLPTLLDVTCCVRLHTLLHVVGGCCVLCKCLKPNCCIFEMKYAAGMETCTKIFFCLFPT